MSIRNLLGDTYNGLRESFTGMASVAASPFQDLLRHAQGEDREKDASEGGEEDGGRNGDETPPGR